MFAAIKRFFLATLRNLWRVIKRVISGALERFLAEFLEIAKKVVKDLMTADLSNEEKRKEAFKRIEKILILRGKKYKESYINILIELALAAVKIEF